MAKPNPKQIAIARAIAEADTGFKLKDRYLPPDSRVGPLESENPEIAKWRLYLKLARAAIKAGDEFEAEIAAKKVELMIDDFDLKLGGLNQLSREDSQKLRQVILGKSKPGVPEF